MRECERDRINRRICIRMLKMWKMIETKIQLKFKGITINSCDNLSHQIFSSPAQQYSNKTKNNEENNSPNNQCKMYIINKIQWWIVWNNLNNNNKWHFVSKTATHCVAHRLIILILLFGFTQINWKLAFESKHFVTRK